MKKLAFLFLTIVLVSCGEKPQEKMSTILIHTDYGDMKAVLYNDTPKHRDNFVKLAKEGYFDGTQFHRIIQSFMIQGGDPYSRDSLSNRNIWGTGGPGYTIPAEMLANHIHKKGALSAARMGNAMNPKRESSGSQFYIVQGAPVNNQTLTDAAGRIRSNIDEKFQYAKDQQETYKKVGGYPYLDMDYTVFGEVIEGLDVIDKIAAVETELKGYADRPVQPVTMTIKVLEEVK